MRFVAVLGLLLVAGLGGFGCGEAGPSSPGPGGAGGSGSRTATGGNAGTGGDPWPGGSIGSGGQAGVGGTSAAGGEIVTGGQASTGGDPGIGGTAATGGIATGGIGTGGMVTGGLALKDAAVDSPSETGGADTRDADEREAMADRPVSLDGVAEVGESAPDTLTWDAPASTAAVAVNIKLTKVELTQAVSTPLGPDSAGAVIPVAARNAKALENRATLVRAHFTVAPGWTAREIEGVLFLSDGRALSAKKSVTGDSTAGTLASTFNFELAPDQACAGLHGVVELHEVAGSLVTGSTAGARFPETGAVDLGLQAGPMEVKVSLVPLTVGGVTPAVTAADIKTVSDWMMGVYPAQKITIATHAAYDSGFTTFGDAQEEAGLNLCAKIKVGADAATNLYHVLIVPGTKATVEWDGVGNLTGPGANEFSRRCCLVITQGAGTVGAKALTIAHEIGHNHGLDHAPCGAAANPDPGYPYAGGKIGVQGYHILKKTLIEANTGTDFMGYCDSTAFVSDYFWNKLETRIRLQSAWRHAPLSGRSLSGVFRSPGAINWVIVRGNLGQPTDAVTPTTFARIQNGAAAGALVPLNLRPVSDGVRLTQVALPLPDGQDARRFDISIDGVASTVDLALVEDLSR